VVVTESDISEIEPLDRPSDGCSLWLSATGDCYKSESIDRVVEVKPEDLQDMKQEPADENDIEVPHYSVKVRFLFVGNWKVFLPS